MSEQSNVQPPQDDPQEPAQPPELTQQQATLAPQATISPRPTLPTLPPPYMESSTPYYWAPQGPSQPEYQQPTAAGTIIGSSLSVIGALAAVVAFFVLPYVNLLIFGSYTGAQLATAVGGPSSSGGSTIQGQITASNFSLLMWASLALVALAGAIALWQIAHRRRHRYYDFGEPISPYVALLVQGSAFAGLLIQVYLYSIYRSGSAGSAVALFLGSGFWGIGVRMVVAALGAMIQILA